MIEMEILHSKPWAQMAWAGDEEISQLLCDDGY